MIPPYEDEPVPHLFLQPVKKFEQFIDLMSPVNGISQVDQHILRLVKRQSVQKLLALVKAAMDICDDNNTFTLHKITPS